MRVPYFFPLTPNEQKKNSIHPTVVGCKTRDRNEDRVKSDAHIGFRLSNVKHLCILDCPFLLAHF